MANRTQYETFMTALTSAQAVSPIATMIQKLSDGVFEETPLLKYLKENCKRPLEGGPAITFQIKTTATRSQGFSGDGSITVSQSTTDYKKPVLMRNFQVYPVKYNLTDVAINKGKDAMVNYVAERIVDAKEGIARTLTLDLYGDGTNSADGTAMTGDPLVGLALAVEPTPATSGNSYAGITRSASTTYFNNQYLAAASTIGSLTVSNLEEMTLRCTHGGKTPDLIITNDTAFAKIKALFANDRRFVPGSSKSIDGGFPTVFTFNGASLFSDKHLTASSKGGVLSADKKVIYFLNTKDAMEYRVDPEWDMKLTGTLEAIESNTYVQKLIHSSCFCVTNPRFCGVITYA